MDCRDVQERLDALLEGRLSADERRAVEAHARACPDCRDLVALARMAAMEPPPELVGSVLERTSGRPACGSARARLVDWVDGSLPEVDSELVGTHVAGCAECRGLAHALERLADDLPVLAELAPDERFVDDVLVRTVPRGRRLARRATRLARAWPELLRRPRFALEAAYAGTVVLALLFGSPASPLAGAPVRALELARRNPVSELKQPSTSLLGGASVRVRDVWKDTHEEIRRMSRAAAATFEHRSRRAGEASRDVPAHGAALRDALSGADPVAALVAVEAVVGDLDAIARACLFDPDDNATSDDARPDPQGE